MGRIADLFAEQRITLPVQRKQQMLARDREDEKLKAKVDTLEADNLKLRAEVNSLKSAVDRLKHQRQSQPSELDAAVDNPKGYRCDHCGSPKLKRIGNRRDPTFGDMGIKQEVFRCLACNLESAFTP